MEIWKDVPGYEGFYQVSSLGNVKSLNYNRKGQEKNLKVGIQRFYYNVCLSKNDVKQVFRVHRLVALTFLGLDLNSKEFVVDHINSIKTDNRLENLRLVTQRENSSKEVTLKSGLPAGVCKFKNKFKAKIVIGRKHKHIGLFSTPEEASAAYQKELQKIIEDKHV